MKKYSDNISERLSGRHKKCMAMVNDVKDKDILDIGCSFGWFEKFALNNGCNSIVGLDSDDGLLTVAKEQVKDEKVTFMKGTALTLPFEPNKFDKIAMFDVIEHIPKNSERISLSEICRVLKNNGEFYLSTPNRGFIANIFDPAWYFGHRHYSIKQLRNMMEGQGLTVESHCYGGGWWDIAYMLLLYCFKWILRSEVPMKKMFDIKRDREYLIKKKMFNIIFIKAKKKNG